MKESRLKDGIDLSFGGGNAEGQCHPQTVTVGQDERENTLQSLIKIWNYMVKSIIYSMKGF